MPLLDLTRTILLLIRRPISRVRLARLVYFVHKELIRKKFMSANDITYIRSPLGPVPEGFLTLEHDDAIVAQPNISSNLSYTDKDYAIDPRDSDDSGAIGSHDDAALLEQYSDVLKTIERTLKALRPYTTPTLVAKTHEDPSWRNHANGEAYTITPADLKNPFPFSAFPNLRITIRFLKPNSANARPANTAGAMQANLLRGMISDIVRESTDLEHPDQSAAAKPANTESNAASTKTSTANTESAAKPAVDAKPTVPSEPA